MYTITKKTEQEILYVPNRPPISLQSNSDKKYLNAAQI